MTEHYTIKELAEAKGASAPVRAALLQMEAMLMKQADQIEADGQEIDQLRVDLEEYRRDAEDYADLIGTLQKRIAELEREKAVVSDLLEQQKELALEYLFDCNRAGERIAELEAALQLLHDNIVHAWPAVADLGPVASARAALGKTK